MFPVNCRDVLYNITMGLPLIFSLGDSLIRLLNSLAGANPNYLNHQFLLGNVATFEWHDVRGWGGGWGWGWGMRGFWTVAKALQCDLPVVVSFAPDIVI